MKKTLQRAALSALAASALLLSGGTAFADDEAEFTKKVEASFAVAGEDGAAAGSFKEYIESSASHEDDDKKKKH